jgi:hypothetical protein
MPADWVHRKAFRPDWPTTTVPSAETAREVWGLVPPGSVPRSVIIIWAWQQLIPMKINEAF